MLLKKLELCGFKSFADKTEFDFHSGVTAVVGPNGCGKSNVVDAFRWILGEQSAKAVRGTQMADVIFSGTSSRRSLGFAEASLTFFNDRGVLPVEYSEVCVTRRLYRSGESEYFLNRQPCRLRDIRTLFMDTGVGVDTYSIIEQGKVDRFIQSNARERREIFEEAAGISRYKAQRREAQNRLDRTRLNLEKVDIQLEEQRKQLRSIKYQAAKARRFRECTARLRDLVVALSVKNYREWDARRLDLEGRITGLDERHNDLAAEVAEIEQLMAGAAADANRLENAHLQKRDALHQTQSRVEAAETAIAHNTQRIRESEEESERSTRQVWTLTEKLRQTREELTAAQENLEAIREAIQRQAERIAAETGKAEGAGSECARLGHAIDEWKNRTIQIIERATTLRNELNHMDSSRRQQLARRSRLQGQLQEKTGEMARLEEEINRLAGEREEISGRLADRGAMLHEKVETLAQLETDAQTLETRLRDLQQREAQMVSRREMLQDLEMRAEDVESGVKRLLRGEDEALRGMHIQGMVADLIHADFRHAAAIEAALGDAAQYVVTVGESDAGAAAALLRADRSGRAGLIALTRARAADFGDLYLTGQDGVVGRAADLVRYAPELEPVVRHLLGNTWVVENLSAALRFSGNGGARMRFVTLDGERVDPSGVIFGGEPLPRAGIISRKSELEAIEQDLGQLSGALAISESDRGRIAEHVESLRGETTTLRKEIERGNLEKLSNENEILNRRRRQKLLADESAVIGSEIAEIEATVEAYAKREADISHELEEAIHQRDQLQAEMDGARRSLAEQQAALDRLRQEITRLKVELADKEARRGGLEQGIASAKRSIAETESQSEAVRARIDDLRAKQAQAAQEIAQARLDLERLAGEKEQIEAEIAAIRAEQEKAQAMRAEYAEKARAFRAEQDAVRKQLQELHLEAQELRVRMEGLIERVFNEQGVRLIEVIAQQDAPAPQPSQGLSDALLAEALLHADAPPVEFAPAVAEAASVAAEPPAPPDWAAIAVEIESLREKIRRMGGVNEESIDEETSLEIGIAQTEGQRNDLAKAIEDLQEVIRKLNRVCRERFVKTFEEVRVHFQETFRRLFGGGKCDLILQQEEGVDVLDSGIDVLACPPGKELRSITLLSGGEKTMTTIALLFAIFRAKPSPFCILDEIDAALDEANIDRFTRLLAEEFITSSQFIIITHSKRTVGIASTLYGITMQEKGVSKKVSVKVEDVSHMTN